MTRRLWFLAILGIVAISFLASCSLTGPAGKDGSNGTNGTNGANGTNGTNGVDSSAPVTELIPQSTMANALCAGGGTIVTVNYGGTIYSSTDGINSITQDPFESLSAERGDIRGRGFRGSRLCIQRSEHRHSPQHRQRRDMESGHHAEYPPVRQPRQCCLWRRSFRHSWQHRHQWPCPNEFGWQYMDGHYARGGIDAFEREFRELEFLRRQHRRHLSLLERQRQFLVWRDSPIRHYDQHRRDLIRKRSLSARRQRRALPGKSRRHNLVRDSSGFGGPPDFGLGRRVRGWQIRLLA